MSLPVGRAVFAVLSLAFAPAFGREGGHGTASGAVALKAGNQAVGRATPRD